MSREVDSRVVEMRFDNANFEKNTKQTMNTIDRLMEKLRFKGAEKGFEQLDAASEQVDFAAMSRSLDTLESKFSALNIMATTALVNITNKVVNAGERMVKSLSLDQVTSGWSKYAEKTANVQTIMNATGKSIDEVNNYLNELMWYSDETSYSFSDMTSSVAQLTSAGGDIEKLIPMVEGIANATAFAGKGAAEFSRAIYNLNQSYSSGSLQYIDWKSLDMAGISSEQLKQTLIDVGVELGKIKKGEVTVANFGSTLSKKWATTEVMEKGFGRFSELTKAAYRAVQAGEYDTATEAIAALGSQYDDISTKAFKAAQEAKSFAEAIESTKDAASSSWMRVFETILGNKDESTKVWSELAERLYDIFVPPVDAIRKRLTSGLSSGWEQLNSRLGDQANSYIYALEQVALASGAITKKQIADAGSFSNAIRQGGISADLLKQSLDAAQSSAEKMLTLSDKELAAKGTSRENIEKEAKAYAKLNQEVQNGTLDLDAYAKKLRETSGREHLIQSLWNLMDAVNAIVKPIHEAFQDIFPPKTGEQIQSLAQWLDATTKKLIISEETAKKLKNIAEGVFSVLRVGKDILTGVISSVVRIVTTMKPLGDVFLDMASGVGEFASQITNSLHPLETITAWVTKFVNAAAPVLYSFGAAADKIFLQFAEGAKNAFNEFDPDKLNQFILGGMGASMLVSVKGFLDSIKSIGSSAKDIVGGIKDTIESLGETLDAWKQAKKADTLLTIAKAIALIAGSLTVLSMVKSERLGPAMLALTTSMGGLLGVLQAMTVISRNVSGLKFGVLSAGMVTVSAAILVLSGALKVISTIESEKLLASVFALGGVMAELTVVGAALSKDSGRFMKGATGLIAFAAGVRILASAMTVIGKLKWGQLGKGLAGIGGLCAELGVFAAALNNVKFGVGKGSALLLLAASMNVLVNAFSGFSDMSWTDIGKGLAVMAGALTEFALALNFTKGTLGSAVSLTVMAAALNLLVPAIKGLAELSLGEIGIALLSIAGAFGVLGGAAVLLAPLTPVIVALSLALSAVALSLGALMALGSASMFISNLASSLSLLNSLDFQVFLNSIKALGWMLVEFIAGVFEGIAKVSSSLVTSIATIISSLCDAIVLAAPSIGNALYVVGTTVIDTIVKLLAYIWAKIEPALNDLWEKFKGWCAKHNPLDISNWVGTKDKIDTNSKEIRDRFWQPFNDIADELKNGNSFMSGLYQAFFGAGENASEGLAKGQIESEKEVEDASKEVVDTAVDTTKRGFKSHSPSKVMEEIGRYVTEGLAVGIADPEALAKAQSAMTTVAEKIRNVFTTFWGIHSPSDLAASDAENIIEGAILGISDTEKQEQLRQASYNGAIVVKDGVVQALDEETLAVQEKMVGLYDAFKLKDLHLDDAKYQNGLKNAVGDFKDAMQDNVIIPTNEGLKKPGSSRLATKKELANNKQGDADAQKKVKDPWGVFTDYYSKVVDDATNPSGAATTKAKSKGKSLADTLTEEYSKRLKANKAKMDAAGGEYDLWEARNGETAAAEELAKQKGESLVKAIRLQTERVAIAKEQYDELTRRVGAEDEKTRSAYTTLLSEEKTLAELQRDQKKTLAGALTDLYDKKLKANKTASDTAENEYALWEATGGDSASVEELIRRKTDSLTGAIETQTERVAIAKEQYDTLLAEVGADNDETKNAYNDLLSEQTTLANLEKEKNDAIFKMVKERYEADSQTAQDEYALWSAVYEDSASVTEKTNRKLGSITAQLTAQAKILSEAEQAYLATKEQFGEASAQTQEAYRQYLEEKTARQELENDLTAAQLEAFDNEVAYLEKQEKLITNRQNMLAKLYNDGELANRENAYKQAVEEYGEGTLEARRAAATGSMTAIMGVKSSLESMSYSLRKVTNKQAKYNEAVKQFGKNSEKALDAMADLQDEQYSFVGFAEALGEAFEMDDTGKQIMSRLGYAIAKNWEPIQSGFDQVWKRVEQQFPETAEKLAKSFGLATKDGFGDVATDLLAFFKDLAIGDWGSAISTGLVTVLDFVGSEFGRNLISMLGNALWQLPSAFGELAAGGKTVAVMGQTVKAAGVVESTGSALMNLFSWLGEAAGTIGPAVTGAIGNIGAAIGEMGGTIMNALAAIGPEGWIIAAVVAGAALIIANWDKVSEFLGNLFDGLGEAFTKFFDWVVDGFRKWWQALTDICSGIVEGIKEIFGIHSPSTVMAEIGEYLGEGLAEGITAGTDAVSSSMDELAGTALSAMEDVVGRVNRVASEDFTCEPGIRPVVDLSGIQNGGDWLDPALAKDRTVTLTADRSAGLAADAARSEQARKKAEAAARDTGAEDRSNADIVAAVDALGEHVDNIALAVSRMQVSLDKRKLVGEIITDVDEGLGKIARRR